MVKAAGHPLRHRIWLTLAEREASPNELAEELGAKLGTVAYHVKWLAGEVKANRVKLIELVATDTRNGGTIHVYRASVLPLLDAGELAEIPLGQLQDASGDVVAKVIEDLVVSHREGTLGSDPAMSLLRSHHWFDQEALERSAELTMQLLADYQQLEAESLQRLAERGEEGIPVATHTNVFPVPGKYFKRD